MDYKELTAPCGLFCGSCVLYKAQDDAQLRAETAKKLGWFEDDTQCKGCRPSDSQDCPVIRMGGTCEVYSCIQEKALHNCSECEDFPCDYLHPYADSANDVPHNTKVFNLCLIKKMGLEKWAEEKAENVYTTYFTEKWHL